MNPLLPPLPPNFEAALRDVNAQGVAARLAAARRLGQPSPPQMDRARAGLRHLLKDPLPSVRGAALEALAAVAVAEDHHSVRAMLDDPDPMVRELAVLTLADIAHPDRDRVLAEALAHPAPEVRFQALAACARLCPEATAERMYQLASDGDPRVREGVARALAPLAAADGTARERLGAMLADEQRGVRWEAALSLASHHHPAALPQLLAALDDPDRRLDAVEALAGYHDPCAADRVQRLSEAALLPPILRAAAGRTLLAMKRREAALRALTGAMRAFRGDGRNYAVQTIGDGRLLELAPELSRLARRPRGTDLLQLVEALSVLAPGSQAAVEALAQLARRPDAVGRAAAAGLPQNARYHD